MAKEGAWGPGSEATPPPPCRPFEGPPGPQVSADLSGIDHLSDL